jgi:hypothetical protein
MKKEDSLNFEKTIDKNPSHQNSSRMRSSQSDLKDIKEEKNNMNERPNLPDATILKT